MSKPESPGQLSDFDYQLPDELIARKPLPRREDSRLLVVDRRRSRIDSRRIEELPSLLDPGDCLVVNDTRVLPARLLGHRVATGGAWEGLYLDTHPSGTWRIIGQTRGQLKPGERIALTAVHESNTSSVAQELLLLEQGSGGVWLAELDPAGDTLEVLKQFGTVPLPPYIQRQVATEEDRQRYQTVFARHPGAVAAPTAGLHLSTDLLDACDRSGLGLQHITLHVGLGTFRPIAAEQLDEHLMHSEWCQVTQATSKALENVRRSGHRVVAVGTTVVRTLETAAANGSIEPFQGHTDLFIRPGHTFRSFDALLTNFHLPRSTLFVLVCTVCGIDLAKSAYAEAIARRYRFYSYGDAMLIL
jgi:S-adenosylmethionine:tRNA ribosyltransferase-isomerase